LRSIWFNTPELAPGFFICLIGDDPF
jgi:hypothetical protein